ncbi:MAG: hypothetical protein J6U20_07970 [Fibrobacter sp.]|nr:hypothetical protein [Fibrobacter sp.]
MKKIILILALTFFSLASANCLKTIFEFQRYEYLMHDKDYSDFVLDSMYVDKGTANNRGERIYTWKGYYKDGILDSVHEGDYRDGEWEYRDKKYSVNINITHEGNVWTIIGTSGEEEIKDIIYFDGDSLAVTTTDEDGEYTSIYVLKNDTIFRSSEDQIIVMDETDTNTCYQKEYYDGTWTTWDRFETSNQDGRITVSKTYIEEGLDNKVMIYYMVPRNGVSTTSIHSKIRPAIIPEKVKKFDLLGRPAKGEHIIKVNR